MLRRRGSAVVRLSTAASSSAASSSSTVVVKRRARPWPPSSSSLLQQQPKQQAHRSSLQSPTRAGTAARSAAPPAAPPPLAARPALSSLLSIHGGAAWHAGSRLEGALRPQHSQQRRLLHESPLRRAPTPPPPPHHEQEPLPMPPPLLASSGSSYRHFPLLRWGDARAGAAISLLRPSAGSRPFSSQPARPADSAESAAKATAAKATAATAAPNPPAAAGTPAPPTPRYVEEGFNPQDLKPEAGVEDPRKEENSPRTVGGVVRRYGIKAWEALRALPGAVYALTLWAGKFVVTFVVDTAKNPASLREKWVHMKRAVVEEFQHYKVGSKVLWADMKTSGSIVRRLLEGHTLSRRERRQLTRTSADLFRLVPFAFFVIVPFMELLLPFALKLFPNMLPSTFQDSLKTEENMKRELRVRLALAGFLKDTLTEIGNKKGKGLESPNAALLNEFVQKARAGTHISTTEIQRFARLFKDELTLDNMSRPQLAGMCVYMGLRPYGSDNFLRFQLRAKLRSLKEDDQRIVWEGVDNMTKAELREACRERGMRAYGLTQLGYRRQLQQWLDLSINKEVPISLLILSRAFTLDSKFTDPAAAVADSISSLDKDVVDEVILDVASGAELRNPELRAKKLESIERQNELIQEERKREEARRKKQAEEEERRKKKQEEEEKAKAAAAAPATAAAAEAAVKAAEAKDTRAVEEAAAQAAAMTGGGVKDGVPAPAVNKEEALPVEKVLTEAAIVGTALPSLEEKKGEGKAAAAAEGEKTGKEAGKEQEKEEGGKKKGVELSMDEVQALRTLVQESSVDQEKSVLAKLKAELQATAAAKAAAAAAAAAASKEKEKAPAPLAIEPSPAAAAPALPEEGAAATPLPPPLPTPITAVTTAPPAAAPAPTTTSLPAEVMAQAAATAAAAAATPSKLETVLTPESGTGAAAAPSTSAEAAAPTTTADATAAAAAAPTAPEEGKPVEAGKGEGEEEEEEEEEEEDGNAKSVERMRLKVASMLDRLEHDIEKVESTIGDKLHMLDKDKDGLLSTAELSEVIFHVLKRHNSEEEARKLAAELDRDADGVLTVQELMEWIEHKEELLEELGHENDHDDAPPVQRQPAPKPKPGAAAAGDDGGSAPKS